MHNETICDCPMQIAAKHQWELMAIVACIEYWFDGQTRACYVEIPVPANGIDEMDLAIPVVSTEELETL